MKRCFKLGMVVVLSLCFLGCGAKADKKSSETVSEFKAEDISCYCTRVSLSSTS